jgi:acetyl-CoA synthetase
MANFKWITPKPGSTGKPSAIYNIALVNEDGKECEIGEEGEIVIRGARDNPPVGLTAGYLGDDEANEKLWRGGDFHTGDNAWMDEDGYIWFIGRVDDVIKCSGYRIGPFEVESALMTHPAVLECAITAAPDPVRGQVVKATVVLVKNRGYEPTDELRKELQNHVKKVTAPYKYPRILEFVDELPKTVSGKIRRAAIRHKDSEG